MKKFVNDPKEFVPEFLEGIALASDGTLKYEPKYKLIYRADMPKSDRVSIIQGSGSGHEPAHTMIVGPGMLDATASLVRTPAGHPEGYIEAFANLYRAFASAIRGDGKGWFPGVTDGLRTMRFIEAVIANVGSDQKWTLVNPGENE